MMKIAYMGKKIKRYANQQEGSILIEGFMGLISLFIICSGIFSTFIAGYKVNAQSEDRTVAANIARYKMEELVTADYDTVVSVHPPGETPFLAETTDTPYWTLNPDGTWKTSLIEGKYTVTYPGYDEVLGIIPDPLPVKVEVSWVTPAGNNASLILRTMLDD
jgi:hypothetical protein